MGVGGALGYRIRLPLPRRIDVERLWAIAYPL